MKRCPQCGREYDLSMSFCLDDGAELLYGPASALPDEPQTAVLHETAPPNEAATRAQIHTTEQTSVHRGSVDVSTSKWVDKRLFLAPLLLAIIVVGGFFGYRYLSGVNSRQISSIAVMPFVNESGDQDVEYLSDGMTETLIKSLSLVPNLNVKGRSSVFRYKGKDADAKTVGRELGVQAVLYGRVVQRGDQVMLGLELLDATTENVIWSEKYERKQADLMALQSDVARDVSNKLKTKLSGADEAKVTRSYTADTEAYQLYLKGLFHWNKRTAESLKKSIDYFDQATQRDPNYALAYAGLALTYVLIPQYSAGTPDEWIPKGKAAADKALQLDETVAEAHTALALALFSYDRNIAGSNTQYQRAIELNPNYATAHQWYGNNLVVSGRYEEAIAEGKRAVELDPLSLIVHLELGANYHYARQNDKAVAQLRKASELDPNWYLAHMVLCQVYDGNGQFREAVAECHKARELNDDPAALGYLGHVYAVSGQRDEAAKIIKQMTELAEQRYVAPYSFAIVYAGLGDKDQAFHWLERSYQIHGWEILYLKVDQYFDDLRDDPRYTDLIRRLDKPAQPL